MRRRMGTFFEQAGYDLYLPGEDLLTSLDFPGAGSDAHEILGVQRKATADEMKAAFRKKAKELHPDRNPGDEKADQRFRELNEAYDVLKDDQKRAAYDQYGHQAFEGPGGGPGGPPK